MDNKKYLLIGPISPPITGPGVKNRIIVDYLLNSNLALYTINTLHTNYLFVFWAILKNFSGHDRIILSVSANGRFLISPILLFLIFIYKKKELFLFAAGGNFDKEIQKLNFVIRKVYLSIFRKYNKIVVESEQLKNNLKKLGLDNIEYLPNPRNSINKKWKLPAKKRLVFLSKIKEEKGVVILIEVIKKLNQQNEFKIEIDFFGVIEESFKDHFLSLMDNQYFFYRGVCEYSDVQITLLNYYCFILPTYYDGEGMPGAIVEALMVGMPIITTNFRYAHEIIINNINGIIVKMKSRHELEEKIEELIKNPVLALNLSEGAKNTSKMFKVSYFIKKSLS